MKALNPSGRDRFRWIEAAMASTDLLAAEKVLLVRLGLHCNDETGRCDPGENTLAAGTGLSARYVRKLKIGLREKCWIGYDDNEGGAGRSNRYVLLMGRVPEEGSRNYRSGFEGATRNGKEENLERQSSKPRTPAPPNNNLNNNSNTNADGAGGLGNADAALQIQANSLAHAIVRMAGLTARGNLPPHWQRPCEQVAVWLKKGYPPVVILSGVQVAMARRNLRRERDPPTSIRYFEKPIEQAWVDCNRPLPAIPKKHGIA